MSQPITKKAPGGFHQNSRLDSSEIENFNNSIPFDPLSEEVSSLIPTILEHSTGSAYQDTYLNPQHHYNTQTKDLFAKFEIHQSFPSLNNKLFSRWHLTI